MGAEQHLSVSAPAVPFYFLAGTGSVYHDQQFLNRGRGVEAAKSSTNICAPELGTNPAGEENTLPL